ncbi:hypothetical protein HW555_013692, partial [Spodoptera exigua]
FEMDMFEDFDISQDDLSQLDQIEINLLNNSFHISSDEEDNIHPVSRNRRRIMVIDSEESESEERPVPATSGQTTPRKRTWTLPTGNQRSIIPFTENPGLPTYLRLAMSKKSPIDFYSLLVPDDVFGQIVEDTNQFAINTITKRNASKAARIRNWSPTNVHEMKSFFALIMFMGLVKLPKLSDYWSKDEITGHRFASTIMSPRGHTVSPTARTEQLCVAQMVSPMAQGESLKNQGGVQRVNRDGPIASINQNILDMSKDHHKPVIFHWMWNNSHILITPYSVPKQMSS